MRNYYYCCCCRKRRNINIDKPLLKMEDEMFPKCPLLRAVLTANQKLVIWFPNCCLLFVGIDNRTNGACPINYDSSIFTGGGGGGSPLKIIVFILYYTIWHFHFRVH